MQKQHMIMLKRDISLKYAISFEKTFMHIQEYHTNNKTHSLSQDNIHHQTNNTKSSQVNKHINILEHTVKTTLTSSYNVNKHG